MPCQGVTLGDGPRSVGARCGWRKAVVTSRVGGQRFTAKASALSETFWLLRELPLFLRRLTMARCGHERPKGDFEGARRRKSVAGGKRDNVARSINPFEELT